MIKIIRVRPSSPAAGAGIHPGDYLVSINGEAIIDEIDYQALIQHAHLEIELSDADGLKRHVTVAKPSWEQLGIQLDETVAMKPRVCRNHCIFCFVDQMPKGMRSTLYLKDDDWRLSLMMGNYVTLTNVDDKEFTRILRRKASPLYISVHATDGNIRAAMLRNPRAVNIMQQLTAFKNHGIQFHSQIVLCPGFNDGDVLKRTVEDLASLWPAALSVAVVPVGMTKFRKTLAKIPPVDRDKAEEVIQSLELYQNHFLSDFGTRFVFPSDEFYCICGKEPPEEEDYEDYPQIENGVGLIRQLKEECAAAFREMRSTKTGTAKTIPHYHTIIATGVSVQPHIAELVHKYAPRDETIEVVAVHNRYFGESITVTGLIVGQDLIDTLKDKEFDRLLISASMLRESSDCFLDDITLGQVKETLGRPVHVVENSGDAFIGALYHMEE